MVGREAPFRPFSGREAPISLNFSNWHPFFEFFLIPFLEKSRMRWSISVGPVQQKKRYNNSQKKKKRYNTAGPSTIQPFVSNLLIKLDGNVSIMANKNSIADNVRETGAAIGRLFAATPP
jgi:hypothetical protein